VWACRASGLDQFRKILRKIGIACRRPRDGMRKENSCEILVALLDKMLVALGLDLSVNDHEADVYLWGPSSRAMLCLASGRKPNFGTAKLAKPALPRSAAVATAKMIDVSRGVTVAPQSLVSYTQQTAVTSWSRGRPV